MTDNDINRTIAEYLGWKNINPVWSYPKDSHCDMVGKPPPSEPNKYKRLVPDFANDLNAMHEAEVALETHDQAHEFKRLIHGDVSANARQRAEAFLRTIGKWRAA